MLNPQEIFLREVKSIAKNKAILIFDEITSGFKDNYGGLHLKLKVNPDMAIFGKIYWKWISNFSNYRKKRNHASCPRNIH